MKFFMKDFKDAKAKKQADKNALSTLSYKKFEMSVACFILAGKLKDALYIALDKLQDLILAMLICRLQDGEDGALTHELLDNMFIE